MRLYNKEDKRKYCVLRKGLRIDFIKALLPSSDAFEELPDLDKSHFKIPVQLLGGLATKILKLQC